MLEMRILSPLAKVFPDCAPQPANVPFEGMRNEIVSFQLAFRPESAVFIAPVPAFSQACAPGVKSGRYCP